jgi:hypothetical protein
VITEHDLLLDREIELGRVTGMTEHNSQRIERLLANLFRLEKVVAPRLVPELDDQIQVARIADATDHKNHS